MARWWEAQAHDECTLCTAEQLERCADSLRKGKLGQATHVVSYSYTPATDLDIARKVARELFGGPVVIRW